MLLLALLAALLPIEVRAQTISGCSAETARWCASAAHGTPQADCLERHRTELSPSCRAALDATNPQLQASQELQDACAPDLGSHCSKIQGIFAQGSCLEPHFKSLSAPCQSYVLRTNADLRNRLDRERREAQAAASAAAAAAASAATNAAKAAADAEAKRLEAERIQLEIETRRQRRSACYAELARETPVPSLKFQEMFCENYARDPAPSPSITACTTRLFGKTQARYRRRGAERLRSEADLNAICSTLEAHSERGACFEAELTHGQSPEHARLGCEPFHLRCVAFMKATHTGPVSVRTREFLFRYCTQYSNYFETDSECTDRIMESYMRMYRAPREDPRVQSSLPETSAGCVAYSNRGIQRSSCARDTVRKNRRFLTDIPMLMHLCDQDEVYRDCVISRFFRLPDYIQALSYPSSQHEQQEIHQSCLVKSAIHAFDLKNRTAPSSCP